MPNLVLTAKRWSYATNEEGKYVLRNVIGMRWEALSFDDARCLLVRLCGRAAGRASKSFLARTSSILRVNGRGPQLLW